MDANPAVDEAGRFSFSPGELGGRDHHERSPDRNLDQPSVHWSEGADMADELKNLKVRFTLDDSDAASEQWGFNCGPAALCAVLDMTPQELRPHLIDFEQKRYTNPSLMEAVLQNLNIDYRKYYRSDLPPIPQLDPYPRLGLVRIQWAGPWTNPGVPMRARYRQTHWVAARGEPSKREIFDVNALRDGGWLPFRIWSEQCVPWIIKNCVPKGTGEWWPTHGIRVTKPEG